MQSITNNVMTPVSSPSTRSGHSTLSSTRRRQDQRPKPTALPTPTHRVKNTRQREARGELHNILLELLDELGGLARTLLVGLDEVGELLGAGLLLGEKGDLDDSVQELGDFLKGH